MDHRSGHRFRFYCNRPVHQPDPFAHADEPKSPLVHRLFNVKASAAI